jgi:hypothetical protein
MAEHFFGYGRWDALYWFIGPEAAMDNDGIDSVPARFESWQRLGGAAVVDCAEHHRGFGMPKWHRHHPPTQATWRQLIRLLLAYKGMNPNLDDIRAYQRDHWGREGGETCVIELSGIPAPNMRVPRDRLSFLSRRVDRIRQEARNHHPQFILMYGTGQREEWKNIAGGEFDAHGFRWMDGTLAAIVPHPVSRGVGSEYWKGLGQRLWAVRQERHRPLTSASILGSPMRELKGTLPNLISARP